jgi:hypothetical protein
MAPVRGGVARTGGSLIWGGWRNALMIAGFAEDCRRVRAQTAHLDKFVVHALVRWEDGGCRRALKARTGCPGR